MREQQLVAGGKRWHGSDFIDLQAETLTPLQKLFEKYGNVVITGCDITFSGGVYSITEGYIGCLHADGYKIAKLAAVGLGSIPTFPIYLKIDKTTETKLYDNGSTLLSVNVYSATATTSVPGSGLYLTILNQTTPALQWKDALIGNSGWSSMNAYGSSSYPQFANGITNISGHPVLFRKNAIGQFEFKGRADVGGYTGSSLGGYSLFNFGSGVMTTNSYQEGCLRAMLNNGNNATPCTWRVSNSGIIIEHATSYSLLTSDYVNVSGIKFFAQY